MFGRDDNPTSGIPGAGPTGLSGLPGGDTAVSLGKPQAAPRPPGPAEPAGPWELGPLGALAFVVVALAAITFGFATDRKHRESGPGGSAGDGSVTATSADSFTTLPRFTKALQLLEAKAPSSAKLQELSVLPDEVEGTMVDREGLELHLDVTSSLKATVTNTGDGLDGYGISLKSVAPGVPARILNAAEQKFHLHAKNLMTFDLSASSGKDDPSRWTVEYTHPSSHNRVAAKFDGTGVHLTEAD